ncbi:MAG: hypothetical protein J6A38_05400, partial [Clostridia bacterium]|nr:hypothetical protein [Clostridia bacterium]
MGKLTIWTWGEYANVARKAVEIYQDEHVDLEQEIEVIELTEAQIIENLRVQGPEGRASADIIMASDELIRKSGFVNGENFVVLNDLIDESAYLENRIEAVRGENDSSIYGVPFTTEPAALFYRKDVFFNAGMEAVSEEITWDNLLSLGVRVKEQCGKYLCPITPLATRVLLGASGYYCYNEDQEQSAENNLCIFDLYDQIKQGGLYRSESEPFDYASESTQNTYSAFIGSNFLLSKIKNLSNANQWAAMKLPTNEDFTNQVNIGGYSWLVTQNANSAAAIEFLNSVFSGNEDLIVYMAERNMISSAAATANVLSEAVADMEFGGDILYKLSVISAAAVLPVQGEYSDVFCKVLHRLGKKVCANEMYAHEAKAFAMDYVSHYSPEDDFTTGINIVDSSVTARTSALNTAYKAGEGLISLKKEIPFAGKAVGQVDLSSGDLTMAFVGVSAENSVMGMPIVHVYDSRKPNENFRLNVYETLQYDDPNYVYTDGNGEKHTFKEKYYYLGENAQKIYISIADKLSITVMADGRLIYKVNDKDTEIFVEHCSASGLKAVTAAEGYNDSEYLEKRQTEYKQLEEQVKAYEKALKEYAVVTYDTGSLSTITTLQDLSTGEVESFKELANENDKVLLTFDESLQYKSLIMQQDAVTKEISGANILAPATGNVFSQVLALRSSLYEITNTLQRHIAEMESSTDNPEEYFNEINGEVVTSDYITETFETIATNLRDGVIVPQAIFNRFKDATLFDEYEHGDNEDYIPKRDGYSLKALFRQRNLYVEQLNEQTRQLDEQMDFLKKQLHRIRSAQNEKLAQFDQYYKEYYNKNAELKKLKQSLPMSFVTDGKQVKGFNEQGMLVAVYDKYENYVGIEYETVLGKTRVSRLYDNTGKQVLCTYDLENRLISITDIHGQKTEYLYDGDKLSEVKFGSNDSLKFGYNGNKPVLVSREEDLHETEIVYGTNTLTFIQKSKLKKIGKELELADSMEERSRVMITFTYGADNKITAVEVEDEEQKTAYELDEQSHATKYVEYANGLAVKAEKYSYEYDVATGVLTKTTATSAPMRKLYATSLADNAFDDGIVETTEYNEFCQPIKKNWSTRIISSTANTETVEKTYGYDLENRLTEVTTVREYYTGGTYTEKETYAYSQKGDLVKTEKYLVGAEMRLGKQIEERIYDEKGNLTKRYTYNSLDGTSKYYLTETKATTENSETGVVYGYDEFGNVTCVSGNTADGEENSTQREYQYGLLTKLVSGNEQVEYEYDEKERVIKIGRNGNAEYNVFTYTETDSGEEITERNANGEERTLQKDALDRLVQESYTVGETQKKAVYEYEQPNRLRSITESENETETRKRVFAYNAMDKVSWYKEIENGEAKITENYAYDKFERLQERNIIFGEEITLEDILDADITGEELVEAESMQYTYAYENTAQGRLEEIDVLGLTIQPKYDILNRPKGKTLCIDGEKLAEEQIVYRKHGDHTTDMPSAVYFGAKTAGMYALNEHVKYAYDERGNIQKVFEN